MNKHLEDLVAHLRLIHFTLLIVSLTLLMGLTNLKTDNDKVKQEFLVYSQINQKPGPSTQSLSHTDIDNIYCRAIKNNCNKAQ